MLKMSRALMIFVGVSALTLAFTHAPAQWASSTALANAAPAITQIDLAAGEPTCDLADDSAAADALLLAKGGPKNCQGCSISIGDQCTRVSCNPCCYSCKGTPYLVCTE